MRCGGQCLGLVRGQSAIPLAARQRALHQHLGQDRRQAGAGSEGDDGRCGALRHPVAGHRGFQGHHRIIERHPELDIGRYQGHGGREPARRRCAGLRREHRPGRGHHHPAGRGGHRGHGEAGGGQRESGSAGHRCQRALRERHRAGGPRQPHLEAERCLPAGHPRGQRRGDRHRRGGQVLEPERGHSERRIRRRLLLEAVTKSRAAAAGALTFAALFIVPVARAEPPSPLLPLVDAAAQRLQTADSVAANKFRTGGPIEDPRREQQVIDATMAEAAGRHIDPAYVSGVFRDQIDATVAVEYGLFSQWKLDPATAPVTAPDLAASRSTIDTLNHTMVDEIAGRWLVLHSPACRADLADAVDAVATARKLDPLFRRALDYATRSYCR
ncbi:chorismate mutase [Mycolicibacterium setense]|nr:chorismate mutase [Mycolicibacterium setense]